MVAVRVPADRLGAFEGGFAYFLEHGAFPAPDPGSDGKDWTQADVPVESERYVSFYVAFGNWLDGVLQDKPKGSKPQMTLGQLCAAWSTLPRLERQFLKLLADGGGRTVGWKEVQAKFATAGPVNVASVLPQLARTCETMGCSIPVDQVGEDDGAAFRLPQPFVSRIRGVSIDGTSPATTVAAAGGTPL